MKWKSNSNKYKICISQRLSAVLAIDTATLSKPNRDLVSGILNER